MQVPMGLVNVIKKVLNEQPEKTETHQDTQKEEPMQIDSTVQSPVVNYKPVL